MTRIPYYIVSLALLLCLTAQAAPYSYSTKTGVYISVSGAPTFSSDSEIEFNSALVGRVSEEPEHDLGFFARGAVGYNWEGFRVELEYSYIRNSLDNVQINAFDTVLGDSAVHNNIMFNIAYDWYLTDSFYWYNGAGLGLSIVSLDKFDEVAFGYQVMTGIGFNITNTVAITLGYRLFSSTAIIDKEVVDYGAFNNVESFKYEPGLISIIEIGMRFNF